MKKGLGWKRALDLELCPKQGIKMMKGIFGQRMVFEPCHLSSIFCRYGASDALLSRGISAASSAEMVIRCGYVQIAAHPVPV